MMQRLMFAIAFLLACPIALAECPKAVEKLDSPSDNTQTRSTSMYFSWSPVQAIGYDLILIRNGVPVEAPATCRGSQYPNCGGTLKPGRYTWYVRSYNKDCEAGTKSREQFSLQIDGCNEVPTPLQPLNGAGDVPVTGTTLTWSGSADAYDVFLEKGTQCTTTTPAKRVTGTGLATDRLEANTTYAWRVRESSESCADPKFSNCTTFTTCGPPGQFDLKDPVIEGTRVKLSWTPAQRASEYVVYTTSIGATQSYRAPSTSICLRLWNSPSSQFTWYVEAFSGNCRTRSISDETFKTSDCVQPTLIAPAQSPPAPTMKAAAPIKFEWKVPQYTNTCEVKDDSFYVVRFEKRKGEASKPPTSCSSFDATSCSASFPPGEYSWYVEAHEATEATNITVTCDSEERTFTVK